MDKIKVLNPRKFTIGFVLSNNTERAVLPGSYTLLSKDDIEHLGSIAPALFQDEKLLRIEDRKLAVELGFIDTTDRPTLDEGEIRKCLNQRAPQVKAWLDTIKEEYILDAIYDVAVQMDLPASKLQLLKERMPEREFIREG